MRAYISKLRRAVAIPPVAVSPVLGVAGLGLACFGISLVSLPAALIVGGVLLVLLAVDVGR